MMISLFLLLIPLSAFAIETNICITNTTQDSHLIKVSGIDNYDWEHNRPDHNFDNLNIASNQTLCKTEDINPNSSPTFNFDIDGSITRMKYAAGKWYCHQTLQNPNALWGDVGDETRSYPASSFLVGYSCSSRKCGRFEIRRDLGDPAKWMSNIKNEKKISQISIPGTHDSAAYKGNDSAGYDFYIAQFMGPPNSLENRRGNLRMDIENQLYAGVRFLDMRARRSGGSDCTLHHNDYYLNQSCRSFLQTIYTFLDKNPSETVLLSVKSEGSAAKNSLDFDKIFDEFIEKNKSKWYVGSVIPTLGENTTSINPGVESSGTNIRGRIVLLRRYYHPGVDFGLYASFPYNSYGWANPGETIWVQDRFHDSLKNKWGVVENALKFASANQDTLVMNYTSGYTGIPSPYDYSITINKKVSDALAGTDAKVGIVVMDFITPQLAKTIYSINFGGWGRYGVVD